MFINLSPHYMLEVESSNVKVKEAKMPKSFFGHSSGKSDQICSVEWANCANSVAKYDCCASYCRFSGLFV